MSSFRKLQVVKTSTNLAEALQLVSVPLVTPKSDQVRVKVIHVGVNAFDLKVINGHFRQDVPFDFGYDAIGIVDEIGSSVPAKAFTLNQPVLVIDLANDTFAEYLYKEPASLRAVPALDPKYLAVFNGLTAAISLEKAGEIKEGQNVLITAASGGTGQFAVQWAKLKGSHVIGLTSSDDKAKYLSELGVDLAINYRSQDLDKVLSEQFPKGVDLIWETIGGETFKTLFNHLAHNGRMIVMGNTSSYADEGSKPKVQIDDIDYKILWKGLTLTSFSLFEHVCEFPKYLPEMIDKMADGTIRVRVDQGDSSSVGRFVGLGHIYRAQQWLHSKNSLGKVVVKIQEE